MQYVFANFLTNIAPIGLKHSRSCQWALKILVQWFDESSRAFLGFRLSTDTVSAKNTFFTLFLHFFHKLAKRIDTTNVTAGKIGSTCCPTTHSTAKRPQSAVPVRYEALSVLQFLNFSATLARSDVKTSENFSQLWLALGSPNFWH